MFSPFDSMVYNAVQRFNTRKDIHGFLLDMRIPVTESLEFRKWEMDVFGWQGASRLSAMVKKTFGSGFLSATDRRREEFQKRVWRVRDRIEYDDALAKLTMSTDDETCEHEPVKAEIKCRFAAQGIDVYKVGKFEKFDIHDYPGRCNSSDLARCWGGYQFEVIIENEDGEPQSVWMKIPTRSPGPAWRPNFIYDD